MVTPTLPLTSPNAAVLKLNTSLMLVLNSLSHADSKSDKLIVVCIVYAHMYM